MSGEYRLTPVAAGLRIALRPGEAAAPPTLEPAIDAAWQAAQRRAGGRLFNGRVVSIETATPEQMSGRLMEYRQIVAGFSSPALAEALGSRPLSVCGVLRTPDGVVFGRRQAGATYEAGLWQMPPAGSVDAGAVRGETVDAEAALRAELAEELGLDWPSITACRPFALVAHAASGVCDLGFMLETPCRFATVAARAAAAGSGEYQELLAVPEPDLAGFLAARPGRVVPAAALFLRELGMI